MHILLAEAHQCGDDADLAWPGVAMFVAILAAIVLVVWIQRR